MIARVLPLLAFGLSLDTGLTAQIPNGGFENWLALGAYEDLPQWVTNSTLLAPGPFICEKGTPGAVGAHYAKVTTLEVPGFGPYGAISTEPFPYSARPAALNGKFRYGVARGDEAAVYVVLTKWNPIAQMAEDIGVGFISMVGDQTTWQDFSVRIGYAGPQDPDTAVIAVLSSFGSPTVGSWMDIDDLVFGALQSVDEPRAVDLTVFPIPASDRVFVTAGTPMAELTLWSADGRELVRQRAAGLSSTVGVRDLPPGVYILLVRSADGTTLRRSIVRE